MIRLCYFLILLIGLCVIHDVRSEVTRFPKVCKALCHHDICVLDCYASNLSLIPKCDKISIRCDSVTELILRNNKIRQLPSAGFAHFTKLRILDISDNPLEGCTNSSFVGLHTLSELRISNVNPVTALKYEIGAFAPLTSLKNIDLSWSWINLPKFFRALCSLNENVEAITMDGMYNFYQLITFDDTWFNCFGNLKLKRLSLNYNHIEKITFQALLKLRSVQHLSLKGNRINGDNNLVGLAAIHNLTYIDLSCQSARFCDDNYPWSYWLPGEPKLFQESNTITTKYIDSTVVQVKHTSKANVFLFDNLQTIFLHNTYVSVILKDIPCWINNRLLNVDFSFVTHINVIGLIPCMQQLKFLNLRGIKSLLFDVKAFHDMPHLKVLMLGSAGLPDDTFLKNNSNSIFIKNQQLMFLDLSNLGLTSLQKNTFCHLTRLVTLILSHNKLSDVDDLLSNMLAIIHIDLSYNNLRDIPLPVLVNMENLLIRNKTQKRYINLSNNPFMCVCSSINNLHRVLHTRVIIHDVHSTKGNLRCTLSNKEELPFIQAYEKLKSECRKPDMVSIVFITVVYPLILCMIFLLTCCFRYSWTLKYNWYNLGNWMNGKRSQCSDERFSFDAFVAHCSRDEEWVRTILMQKLENRKQPYSLCVHYRSFMPGQNITDNIILAIHRSRTTILVVSKAFMRSGWCEFESRVAQQHHLGKTNHRIIAILFPGVYKLAYKKPSLKTLIDNVTALEWPQNFAELEMFWLRLCYALGKPLNKAKDNNYILMPL